MASDRKQCMVVLVRSSPPKARRGADQEVVTTWLQAPNSPRLELDQQWHHTRRNPIGTRGTFCMHRSKRCVSSYYSCQQSHHYSFFATLMNYRYALETKPCDWIVSGYGVFHHLLSPTFLQDTNAPAPGGFISVLGLDAWQAPQCPLLTTSEEDEDEEEDEQEHHDESSINSRFVAFPLKEKCRVLHVGCGNSQLGEYMLHDGFRDIVNVDYSEVVINKSKSRVACFDYARLFIFLPHNLSSIQHTGSAREVR